MPQMPFFEGVSCVKCVTALVLISVFAGGCRPSPSPPAADEPLHGITVVPPQDGDEQLAPIRFVIRNGARELRNGMVQCHILTIATRTTRVSDNTEQAEAFERLPARREHAVHCDPLVFLAPESDLRVLGAEVAVDLEFDVPDVDGRQFARFTFEALRTGDGRLQWRLKDTRGGDAETRYD